MLMQRHIPKDSSVAGGLYGDDTRRALCGAKPGRRSVGWTTWGSDQAVTCPKCLKKLERSRREEDQNSKEPG